MTIPRNRSSVTRCKCGRPYSHDAWLALPWDGDCPTGVGLIVLELRACVCGSTICRPRRGAEYLSAEEYERLQRLVDPAPLAEGGITLEVGA